MDAIINVKELNEARDLKRTELDVATEECLKLVDRLQTDLSDDAFNAYEEANAKMARLQKELSQMTVVVYNAQREVYIIGAEDKVFSVLKKLEENV